MDHRRRAGVLPLSERPLQEFAGALAKVRVIDSRYPHGQAAEGIAGIGDNRTAPRPRRREPPRQFDRKYRSEEHTSELQSRFDLVCRLLLEKKNNHRINDDT